MFVFSTVCVCEREREKERIIFHLKRTDFLENSLIRKNTG